MDRKKLADLVLKVCDVVIGEAAELPEPEQRPFLVHVVAWIALPFNDPRAFLEEALERSLHIETRAAIEELIRSTEKGDVQ